MIWLMLTGDKGYPLSPLAVQRDGSFQRPLSRSRPRCCRSSPGSSFVDVSIAPVTAIRKLVREAIKNTALVLDEPGEVVLRGDDPEGLGAQQARQQGSPVPGRRASRAAACRGS